MNGKLVSMKILVTLRMFSHCGDFAPKLKRNTNHKNGEIENLKVKVIGGATIRDIISETSSETKN